MNGTRERVRGLPRTPRRSGESGQVLVGFAVMVMAVMAMMAVGIDLALVVSGQRRFDQNGADAAAMAAGRLLASYVQPNSSAPSWLSFAGSDEAVYSRVRQYAGLRPAVADWGSANPTTFNQNAGLTTRNKLAATVEYWGTYEWGATWCYSPTGPAPLRASGMPRCTLPTLTLAGQPVVAPPDPDANLPFKLRVTVSSTVDGFFVKAIGLNNGVPPAPALNNSAAAACIRPQAGTKSGSTWTWAPLTQAQAPGRTTCAQATVVISGSTIQAPPKPVIPITTNDCRVSGQVGVLYDLWNSSPKSGCPGDPESPMGSFKNMIDFSDEPLWCDGTPYDYTSYASHTPTEAGCGGTDQWNRVGYQDDQGGGGFPAHPGGNGTDIDVTYWLGRGGYGGKVRPDSCYWRKTAAQCASIPSAVAGVPSNADGNWFPTYLSASPGQGGNLGSNISDGLFCKKQYVSGDGKSCTDAATSPSGKYFFAVDKLEGYSASNPRPVCPDDFGAAYGFGCRDAGVLTWTWPETVSGGTWTYDDGNPDRVRGARILTFRLYCRYDTGAGGTTYCTDPPAPFTTSSSTAFGRFWAPVVAGPPSGGPLTLGGNTISFE